MSVDYYFACEKCRQCIHVAQDGFGGWTFYRGEPDCMKHLGEFLGEHSLCGDRANHVLLLPEQYVEDFDEREWRTARQERS